MTIVYAITGLPGSGKTTLAKQYQATDPALVRVNKDDLRMLHHNGIYSPENEKFIKIVWQQSITQALVKGLDVVVDDAGLLAEKQMDLLRSIAQQNGAELVIVRDCEDVPVDECIKRDAKRANGVGADVIRQFASRYFPPAPRPINPDLPHAIVVDVDGTLAQKCPDRGVFDYHLAGGDALLEPIANLCKAYQFHTRLIVLTGRSEGDFLGNRVVLRDWLSNHNIDPVLIVMRDNKDFSKAADFKRSKLQDLFGRYNIDLVIDDDPTVIAMAQSLGLQTLQPTFF